MVIDSASWVNIVPVTTEGNVVLIRQFRHGIRDVVLEIPGGMIEPMKPPKPQRPGNCGKRRATWPRTSACWHGCCPIPPSRTTSCTCSPPRVAATRAKPQPDAFELIEVLERPLADIPAMIANGEIAHSMVIAAFAFMGLVKPTPKE